MDCELLLSHYLIDSSYSEELSNNFLRIVQHSGTFFFGENDNDNVRVAFSKRDRVRLWFYQLDFVLSNGLTYLVHLRLHDVKQMEEGSLPVFRVVEMWCQHVLGGPYVDKDVDTLLVYDSYYYSHATRVYFNKHKVNYIRASTPIGSRFSAKCYGEGTQGWRLCWDFK